MSNWALTLLVAGGSLAMVLFTWLICKSLLKIDAVLDLWAKREGFRIVRSEPPYFTYFHPFALYPSCAVRYITVEDDEKKQKKCWVFAGWWWMVGFTENIKVRWD